MRKKLLPLLLIAGAAVAITIATQGYDNSRLNSQASETRLTSFNVSRLQKTGTYSTDADVYAQPLYLPGVTVDGVSKNVLVVATMANSVYLFDADNPGSAALKSTNFGGNQPANSYGGGAKGALIYQRQMGCLGTPVADIASSKLWIVCTSATNWILYRLELGTLATLGSVTISGTVSGTGDGGSTVTFSPLFQTARAGLTLTAGNVYVPFGSMSDQGTWHGWIFSYDQTTLAQQAIFCSTPNGTGGGVWQSGGGLSVDGSGNLFAITGNGSGTESATVLNLAVIKLNSSLVVQDWYAPSNWASLNASDWDLASGRPMLIPATNLLVFGAKDFNVYSVDTTCLGNIGGTNNGCTAPQVFATGSGSPTDHQGVYSCMYLTNTGMGYFPNTGGSVFAFRLTGSTWSTSPTVSSDSYGFPGAQMVGTTNGTSSPLVWAVAPVSSALLSAQQGIVYALDSTTLAQKWSSATNSGRDAPGQVAKFNPPIVANGRVYLGTLDSGVQVYEVPDSATTGISGGPLILKGPTVVH